MPECERGAYSRFQTRNCRRFLDTISPKCERGAYFCVGEGGLRRSPLALPPGMLCSANCVLRAAIDDSMNTRPRLRLGVPGRAAIDSSRQTRPRLRLGVPERAAIDDKFTDATASSPWRTRTRCRASHG